MVIKLCSFFERLFTDYFIEHAKPYIVLIVSWNVFIFIGATGCEPLNLTKPFESASQEMIVYRKPPSNKVDSQYSKAAVQLNCIDCLTY